MHVWQKYKATHPVLTRAVWSAVLVFIFLLGKSIPLPYTDAKSLVLQNATLNFASLATGGISRNYRCLAWGLPLGCRQ